MQEDSTAYNVNPPLTWQIKINALQVRFVLKVDLNINVEDFPKTNYIKLFKNELDQKGVDTTMGKIFNYLDQTIDIGYKQI